MLTLRMAILLLFSGAILALGSYGIWDRGFRDAGTEPAVSPVSAVKLDLPDGGRRSDPVPRPSAPRPDAPRFTNIAQRAGISFVYHNGARGQWAVFETMGAGVGFLDADGDGWQDLFLVNSCDLPRRPADRRHTSRLFRNTGDGHFIDCTEAAGVAATIYGLGCSVSDWNNDGFDDLLVSGFQDNILYRNNGDGSFTDVTGAAGIPSDGRLSTSSAWADLDGDGNVDLFICRYVKYVPTVHCYDDRNQMQIYCGPESYPPEVDALYRNNGDGTFRDVTAGSGIEAPNGKGLAVAIADLDNRRRPAICVANDLTANFLFENYGGMKFQEVGVSRGVAYDGQGMRLAGMGVAVGDYDNDGWLDLFVTAFHMQHGTLFHNLGHGQFADASTRSGLAIPTRATMGWATLFLDYDNDGWLDLFVANGHLNHNNGSGVAFAMQQQIFRNLHNGRFADYSRQAGDYFQMAWPARGAATGCIANDRRLAVAISHQDHRPFALLRNDTPTANHAVQVELVGRRCNRVAFNARVVAWVGGRRLIREVIGGGSYLSASDRRVVIGLGGATAIDRLEVHWPAPSERVDRFEHVGADQNLVILEGSAHLWRVE